MGQLRRPLETGQIADLPVPQVKCGQALHISPGQRSVAGFPQGLPNGRFQVEVGHMYHGGDVRRQVPQDDGVVPLCFITAA